MHGPIKEPLFCHASYKYALAPNNARTIVIVSYVTMHEAGACMIQIIIIDTVSTPTMNLITGFHMAI